MGFVYSSSFSNAGEVVPTQQKTLSKDSSPKARPPIYKYEWKEDEIYRFEYRKKITVKNSEETEPTKPRTTHISGYLIFEINSVKETGLAVGTMRFDLPKIEELPERSRFSSQYKEPRKDLAGNPEKIISTSASTLEKLRYDIQISPTGSIRIIGREPYEDLKTGFSGLAYAANWRRKQMHLVENVLEHSVGFKIGNVDSKLLPTSGAFDFPPLKEKIKKNETRKQTRKPKHFPFVVNRATRIYNKVFNAAKREKHLLEFKHFIKKPGKPYILPGISSKTTPVQISAGNLKTILGRAVFDKEMGMLDHMKEAYEISLDCRQGRMKVLKTVSISYELKRIAPIIPIKTTEENLAK